MLFIYFVGCKIGIVIEKVVVIFFDEKIDRIWVVRVVFIFLFRNVLFIVDVDLLYVKSVKILLVDDFGLWIVIGIKMLYFRELIKLRLLVKVIDVLFGVVGVYCCICLFYCNISELDLKCVIIFLKGKYGLFGEKIALGYGVRSGVGGGGKMDFNKYLKNKD